MADILIQSNDDAMDEHSAILHSFLLSPPNLGAQLNPPTHSDIQMSRVIDLMADSLSFRQRQ